MTMTELAEFGKFCNRVANKLLDSKKLRDSKRVHSLKNFVYTLFDKKLI